MAKKPAAKAKVKAKPKGDATPKKERKKSSGGGRRPEGGLGLRDEERQAVHMRHVTEFERALDLKKEADVEFKKTKDRIKEEGGKLKLIELSLALRADDGADTFKARMSEEAEVARWEGVGVQLPLFGEKDDVIFEDGKRAAMQDLARKPPGHLGMKASQRWMDGWDVGREAQNVTRAEGFKKLDEAAAPLLDRSKPMGSVEEAKAAGHKVPPATDDYPPPIGPDADQRAAAS